MEGTPMEGTPTKAGALLVAGAFAVPSALMVPATTSVRFTAGHLGRAPFLETKEHWRQSLARCLVSTAGSHDSPSTAALLTSAAMLVTSPAAERWAIHRLGTLIEKLA